MQWKRRKPLWPMLGVSGCLFVLAIVAPLRWQWEKTGSISASAQKNAETATQSNPQEVVVLVPLSQVGDLQNSKLPPTLPPLKNGFSESGSPTLPDPQCAPEPLPIQQEFDFDTLIAMHNVLLSTLDRLQEFHPEQNAELTYNHPSVRVSSPHDRLAMIPNRHRTLNQKAADPLLLNDFASELLHASRKQHTPTSNVPKVAMRDEIISKQKKVPEDAPTSTHTLPNTHTLPAALRTRPEALIKQLTEVANKSPQTEWATQALQLVENLVDKNSITPINTRQILTDLHQQALAGISNSNPILHPDALQAAMAIQRRLGVWSVLLDDSPSPTAIATNEITNYSDALMPTLSQIAAILENHSNGADWRDYLLLDRLAASTSVGLQSDSPGRIHLAQEVLSRMQDNRLTESQRNFLATQPLAELRAHLQPIAAGPVNLELLDALVERYESGRETRYAIAIARIEQRLLWSPQVRMQALAKHLEEHYRGANMRIAITDDLMNRMIPKQKAIITPVRERVAGAKVRGKSRTTTQVRVQLQPDPISWRIVLEAFGKVYSETKSETWPARVQNAAKMKFQAHKLVVIDQEGMRASPTKAQAQGRNELLAVDSQLDPIPIVGRLLRDAARQKHEQSRPIALRQVKSKVARQARQRMDKETDPKLVRLEQKFSDHIMAPIKQLALLAEPLNMHTTSDRAVMNIRLANREQLAAHTQRPFAPADSYVSMQLHETVLNNAIAGLELDGQRMKMIELFDFFAAKLNNANAAPPADMPQKAVIEFAARDAIRILCEDNRIHLILGVRELSKGRDKIKNFEVHAFFRPVLKGLEVRLVREGTLQFAGRRLKTGPRVVLHSVIGKLLPKDQELGILRADLANDPRLAGLMVTQLQIEKGWIALALGQAHPERTAWQSPEQRMLHKHFVQ